MDTYVEGNRSTVFMLAPPYRTVPTAVKQPDPHVPKGFRKKNFTLGTEQQKRVIPVDPSANYNM